MCRLLIVISFLFSGASAVAQTVSISPASIQSPAVGRQLTVSLKIANGANVAGYQATVVFDTSALRYVGSANGDYLPASAIFIPPIVSGNQVPLAATTLIGEANGAGTLATVTFEVIAVKASTLRLTEVLLSDGEGNASRPRVENGQINAPVVPTVNKPDLVVQSPRVSKPTVAAGESFTLSATVRNIGSGQAAGIILRYYRSTNNTISPSDTQVGTGAIGFGGFASITLNAPSTPGTYYYGACVDPVPNEADTTNNCSTAVSVTVQSTEPPLERVNIPDPNLRAKIEATLGKASGATLTTADMARLTQLDAQNAGIRVLTGLEHATNLETLILDNNSISDLSALRGLTNLTGLALQSNTISDISAVSGLTNLTVLLLTDNTISNISPLARLTNLEGLSLWDNTISNISPLARLTNLAELDLDGNNISNISPLARLTNLTALFLEGNSISDLSPLVSNTGLGTGDEVYVRGNPLSAASVNTHIPTLQRRGVTVEFDAPAPAQPVNIPDTNLRAAIEKELGKASGATITTADMETLTWLVNQESNISKLTGLESATNLVHLNLSINNISDISTLTELTGLEYLNLWDNNITDISALRGLTNLTELSLSENNISDISTLRGLTNLTELSLGVNHITNISVISGLTNLTFLSLGINKVSDISTLRGLTNLTYLYLDGNNISNISPLAGLTNLTELWLSSNNISNISALAGLTNLTLLWLSSNNIRDLSPLVSNTGLGQGDEVNVRGNPLNAVSINTHIPTLQRRGVDIKFDPPKPVNISDTNLRAAIEKALRKASGATITTADMARLTRLDAPNANISVLTGLEHATNLTGLNLSSNTISDISPLAGLTNLKGLNLWDNNITDISTLGGLTNLIGLSLDNNKVTDLSPLLENTGLGQGDTVNVRGNPVNAVSINTHIPTLQRRGVNVQFDPPQPVTIPDTNLRAAIESELGKASGATITPADMTNLTRLDARNANISVLTGLEHATNLTYLHLGGETVQGRWNNSNSVSDISPLAGLTNLTKIWLGDNNLSDISPLAGLTNLETLSLYSNRISDISAVSGLTNLTYLGLAGNTLSDISPLVSNTGLGQGDEVNVKGNPLNAASINTHIPTLQRRGVDIQFDAVVTPTLTNFMYWTDQGTDKIQRSNLDGTQVQDIVTGQEVPPGIALDVAEGKMYWTDWNGGIQRANFDGTQIENLRTRASYASAIALDVAAGKMYWETAFSNKIQRANLDGTQIQDLVTGENAIQGIALDVAAGKMYWTSGSGKIQRANLDGTQIEDLVTGLGFPYGIALDVGNSKMYWANNRMGTAGKIQRANLDGTQIQDIVTGLDYPRGIALDVAGGKIYWVDDGTDKIQRSNLDGTQIQDIVTTGLDSPIGIALMLPPSSTAVSVTVQSTGQRAGSDDAPPSSKYDVNGDGTVNNADASLVSEAISNGSTDPTYDVNDDGNVNFDDLQLVLENRAPGAAGAPTRVGNLKLNALQRDRIEAQIELLIATGDRSPAAMRTLIYLQQLLATARPEQTLLLANYPNPFNPETWIPYHLSNASDVSIIIYDVRGTVVRRLALGHQAAGMYQTRSRAAYWDGRNAFGEPVASGLYLYTLTAGKFTATRKMLIMK